MTGTKNQLRNAVFAGNSRSLSPEQYRLANKGPQILHVPLVYDDMKLTVSSAPTHGWSVWSRDLNPIRCVIAATPEREAIALSAVRCVQARDPERFDVGLQLGSIATSACEILVPVVDSNSCSHIAADLAALRQHCPQVCTLALTVDLSQSQLRGLLASGVQDFATAPLDLEEFLTRLQRAAGLMGVNRAATALPNVRPSQLRDLIGNSESFVRVLSLLPRISARDASVLILGETGTGKEICARAIHYLSARASRPWVAVNCGAIPAELIEAELFGHVRGAFTHAHATRTGLIREAEGGTLFLDEMDSMPLSAQCKVLRFLQDQQYRPVGSSNTLQANVRIIAASNRDLSKLVADGLFRQDLFFRLNVLNLTLPALRERRADIVALSDHFLEHFSQRDQRATPSLGPAARRRLLAYDWPGNVRELKHVLERALLTADGPIIQADHIDLPVSECLEAQAEESFHVAKGRLVSNFERAYILRLLGQYNGNISHAARSAQKNRRAFYELMRKHDIRPERPSIPNDID
jgi:two-component system response regulator GlrR